MGPKKHTLHQEIYKDQVILINQFQRIEAQLYN